MDPLSAKVARRFLAISKSHDIFEAVEYYMASYITEPDGELCFTPSSRKMPLQQILGWDDYSAWGEFRKGELKDLPPDEAEAELASFRGQTWATRALSWLHSGRIPPIILVDGDEAQCIGDGRGRVNLAMAFALPTLDTIILKQSKSGPLCFTFKDFNLIRS